MRPIWIWSIIHPWFKIARGKLFPLYVRVYRAYFPEFTWVLNELLSGVQKVLKIWYLNYYCYYFLLIVAWETWGPYRHTLHSTTGKLKQVVRCCICLRTPGYWRKRVFKEKRTDRNAGQKFPRLTIENKIKL